MGGVGVAPLGLLLAHRRTVSLSAQTENEIARRVTDSLTKAVELLGHKEIAVRQGGIHALGRIAAENREEHPKIMNIIAAYIRHRSRAYMRDEYEMKKTRMLWDEFVKNYTARHPSPIDLEAAVAVIRSRNTAFDIPPTEGAPFLDLSGAFLFRINLAGASLERADFRGSVLRDCMFRSAKLNHAVMHGADFAGSYFYEADMSEVQADSAVFSLTEMEEAKICGADLSGANFQNANLSGVDFSGAELFDAEFQHAHMFHVDFSNASFGGVKFEDAFAGAIVHNSKMDHANLMAADLRGVQPFTEEQIRMAKGNWNTKLPAGWAWPKHWPKDDPDMGES